MPTIKKRGGAAKKQQEQKISTLAHEVQDFMARNRKHFQIAAVQSGVPSRKGMQLLWSPPPMKCSALLPEQT
jgi:hypothetical protein